MSEAQRHPSVLQPPSPLLHSREIRPQPVSARPSPAGLLHYQVRVADTSPLTAARNNPVSLTSRSASRSARTLRPRLFADTSRHTSSSRETTDFGVEFKVVLGLQGLDTTSSAVSRVGQRWACAEVLRPSRPLSCGRWVTPAVGGAFGANIAEIFRWPRPP